MSRPHDSCARSEQHWRIVWRIVATIPPAAIPRSLLRCRERFNGSYRASRCNAWRVEQIFLGIRYLRLLDAQRGRPLADVVPLLCRGCERTLSYTDQLLCTRCALSLSLALS